ncbi:MAG: glycosyltransferase family 2 protein [bacterium]|nr:glycosyltransferase family 2 protein [bacterium]
MDIITVLESIQRSPIYLVVLIFFAWYPIFSSAMWVFTSIVFFFRRERKKPVFDHRYVPPVTVLISAYNEQDHIQQTIEGCLAIDYPNYETLVVDDGSTDGTSSILRKFSDGGAIRLVTKLANEGKAMALNDAIPLANGEIFLMIDADAVPDPGVLKAMVPHFKSSRVAAVTGNPRVANRHSLLSKLQAIEFSSIVSLQRRGSRIWGKLLTISGVVGAFHRTALLDVGAFSPDMATEDIDLTWKLQRRHYDIRYEPRAIVWMRVPVSVRGLWRQRCRWSEGMGQVLRRHAKGVFSWKCRRLWPVMMESVLSIFWAYAFIGLTSLWAFSYAMGYPPVGASPIPNYWGMLIGSMCLLQLLVGMLLDRKYDRNLPWYYVFAVLYPLIYWVFMAVVSVVSTPRGLFRAQPELKPTKWKPVREVG